MAKMRYTNEQVSKKLGKHADDYSKAGIQFLRSRLNGGSGEFAEKVVDLLVHNKVSTPESLNDRMQKAFGRIPNPAATVVILLGRVPTGGIKEGSRIGLTATALNQEQGRIQKVLAKALTEGEFYKNHVKSKKDAAAKPAEKKVTTPKVPKKKAAATEKVAEKKVS